MPGPLLSFEISSARATDLANHLVHYATRYRSAALQIYLDFRYRDIVRFHIHKDNDLINIGRKTYECCNKHLASSDEKQF